ncbi:hypothetical protein D3C72_1936520 [compost metagenome]
MQFHGAFDDGKSQSSAGCFFRVLGFDTVAALEDLYLVLGRNRLALVGYRDVAAAI